MGAIVNHAALTAAMTRLLSYGVALRMDGASLGAHQEQINTNDARISELLEESEQIIAAARGESRDLLEEDKKRLAQIQEDVDGLESDNKFLERQIDQVERKLASQRSSGRQTRPAPTDGELDTDDNAGAAPAPANASGARDSHRSTGRAEPSIRRSAPGMWGWDTRGQFLNAVMSAKTTGRVDERLQRRAGVNVESGEQGAFAVPPDFANSLMTKILQESLIMSRCDQQFVSGNRYVTPIDEDAPWNTASGIRVEWLGERQKMNGSQPNIGEFACDLQKLGAFVELSNESLEDTVLLESLVTTKAPEKIREEIERVIIAGDGVKKPMGILNSAARVIVPKVSGQTADTFVFDNLSQMWSRFFAQKRGPAIFIATQDLESEFDKLEFPGDKSPIYLTQNDVANRPHDTLRGKPLLFSESMNPLGDEGDIMFADFRQYVLVMKRGGVRQDYSMHILFDQDATAFRFIFRIGGAPWWSKPVTSRTGVTRSCFTTVATRA